jgi:hypothetical protein
LPPAAIKTKRADRKGPRQGCFMGGGGRPVKEGGHLSKGPRLSDLTMIGATAKIFVGGVQIY